MANEKEYFWQYYLKSNTLTTDDLNDCVAEILTAPQTLRNEDIVKEIVKRGSELLPETLLYIINLRDRIVTENLLNGHSIMTDICQFTPRVTGVFASQSAPFNPEVNKLTFDVVLSNTMRDKLKGVGATYLGPKQDVAGISLVTDTSTGKADGSITAGEDIRIDGSRVKIAGDESVTGIFFITADGTATKVTRRLTQNDPSHILARVPALADGTYSLRIVTNYSQSNTLLKEPRTLEYTTPLIIGAGGDGGDDDKPYSI